MDAVWWQAPARPAPGRVRSVRVVWTGPKPSAVNVAVGDGTATESVPFTWSAVERLLRHEPLASLGAACLALAWQHRERILDL